MIFGGRTMAEGLIFMMCYLILSKKQKPSLTKHKKMMLLFSLPSFGSSPYPWVPKEKDPYKFDAGMYGAFVQMVDDQIGQLLDYINAHGIADETLFVFTSDNGPIGNHTT